MMSMASHPTQAFVDLCETLYGQAVDPYVVWGDVTKREAGVEKPSGLKRTMEGVALASTVAGGVLGVKEGHGAIKTIRAAGGLRKAPTSAVRNLGIAGLATGGDAITTGVLAAQNRKSAAQQRRLVPTGVQKSWPGPIRPVVAGLRRAWKPVVTPTPAGRLTEAVTHADRAVPPPRKALPQVSAGPSTRAGVKAADAAKAKAALSAKHQAQGADVADMISTTSGKVLVGGTAAVGATAGAKKLRRRGGYEYVPDQYAKADQTVDVTFGGTFSKFDDDKRLAFGWASVTKVNGEPVVDRQGDYIDTGDLEEAVYKYVHESRVGGDMHRRNGDAAHKVSDLVESIVITDEKVAKMNLPDSTPRGWWVGYKIHDDETWGMVKKGDRTGFSIHGKGMRKAQDLDELMGVV